MRVAPLALFACNNVANLVSLTSTVSRITHAHAHAVQGACLQAIAVREALLLDPFKDLDPLAFVRNLQGHMTQFNIQHSSFSAEEDQTSFNDKLKKIKEFLERGNPPSADEVQEHLGVGVAALHSVPTAIYSFLLAKQEIHGIEVFHLDLFIS